MRKKLLTMIILTIIIGMHNPALAEMKKTGQAGMTYLAISMSARESAMGNASTASVRGMQSIFYNVAFLTGINEFQLNINQVSWLADTKLYGVAAGYSFGDYGTVGLDFIYMDYGFIQGTQRVDKAVDPRGFVLTRELTVEDYSFGIAYAYPVNDRFSFGAKIKYVHEDLAQDLPIAVGYKDESRTEFEYEDRDWNLNHWGLDFGAAYETGFEDLVLGVSFTNYSTDMQYWKEVFQMPLALKMGLVMDIFKLFEESETIQVNTAIDLIHPIDYTERIHIGTELVLYEQFSFRGGYQFNHDVENFSLGLGIKFDYQGMSGMLDFAHTNTEYFGSVKRISLNFNL